MRTRYQEDPSTSTGIFISPSLTAMLIGRSGYKSNNYDPSLLPALLPRKQVCSIQRLVLLSHGKCPLSFVTQTLKLSPGERISCLCKGLLCLNFLRGIPASAASWRCLLLMADFYQFPWNPQCIISCGNISITSALTQHFPWTTLILKYL